MALSGSYTTPTVTYVGSSTISFKFSWTATQSTTNNESYVSWTLSCTKSATGWVNGELELDAYGARRYTAPVASGDSRPRISAGTQATGSFTVKHDDSSGTGSFGIAIRGRIYVGTASDWNVRGSTTFYLDTIPRASTLGKINNFNLEDAVTVNVDKKNSSFTDTLELLIDNVAVKTISNYTSRTVSLTNEELARAYNLISSSATSKIVRFKVTTKNGSTTIGSNTSGDITATVAGTARIKANNTWKRSVPWVKVDGVWRRAVSNVNDSGTWKRCV